MMSSVVRGPGSEVRDESPHHATRVPPVPPIVDLPQYAPLSRDIGHRTSVIERLPPGSGRLQVDLIDGQSSATVITAHAPMKLLVPSPRGPAVWAFASSFGGGLVAGDRLALEVAVSAGASAAIGTQSSTKVYRDDVDAWAEQTLTARIGRGAALALLPDPVTPFAGSRYRQRFTIAMAEQASLILIDTCTSGRAAREERWAFTDYDNRLRITRGDVPLVIDATRLRSHGPRSLSERMGRFQAIGTVVLLGPRFAADIAELLAWSRAQAIERDAPLLVSASPVADGVVLRLAAIAYEPIDRWLREHLGRAASSFGDHWSRKP